MGRLPSISAPLHPPNWGPNCLQSKHPKDRFKVRAKRPQGQPRLYLLFPVPLDLLRTQGQRLTWEKGVWQLPVHCGFQQNGWGEAPSPHQPLAAVVCVTNQISFYLSLHSYKGKNLFVCPFFFHLHNSTLDTLFCFSSLNISSWQSVVPYYIGKHLL